jgi:hypothetical protein
MTNPLTITITITPTTAAEEFSSRPFGKGSGAAYRSTFSVERNDTDLNSAEVREIKVLLQESLYSLRIQERFAGDGREAKAANKPVNTFSTAQLKFMRSIKPGDIVRDDITS